MDICIDRVSIKDTGVSRRTVSVLNRAGIYTVGEIIQKNDQQLLEIKNIGVKCLEEIKREIFDRERLLRKLNKNISIETDDIHEVKEFSTRTVNALSHSGITTVSVLKKTTDIQLSKIKNFGAKSIAEIDVVIPNRIKTYKGETENLEITHRKNKIERAGRSVLSLIEKNSMTISELMEGGYRFTGNKKARQTLAEYCNTFPERISDVLEVLEKMKDTSDKLYKQLLSFSET